MDTCLETKKESFSESLTFIRNALNVAPIKCSSRKMLLLYMSRTKTGYSSQMNEEVLGNKVRICLE